MNLKIFWPVDINEKIHKMPPKPGKQKVLVQPSKAKKKLIGLGGVHDA
jgi:hypothetical protein